MLVALATLAFVAGACGGGKKEAADGLAQTSQRPDAGAPIVVPARAPVVIGASVPLTGPDAVVGKEDLAAIIVAVDRWKARNGRQVLGHDIEVRAEDDGCTEAEITQEAAERLLRRRGLVGVLGPDCSAGAEAAIPVYAGAGIVAISGSATRTDLTTAQPDGGFFFRTAYRNDLQGTLIGLFASVALRGKSAYLIDDGEAYGRDLADAAEQAMTESEVEVTRGSVSRGAVDFSKLAVRIAGDGPAFVGFAGFNPEAALLYRQLRDSGYTGGFGGGDAAASLLDFVEPVGAAAAEGVLFSGCPLHLPDDFVRQFREAHGSPPTSSAFVAHYADAVTVLLDALAQVAHQSSDGSLSIDPAELRDAVGAARLADGISGPIAFDADGDRIPAPGADLKSLIAEVVRSQNIETFLDLGLVPCQVQRGKLVNLYGPGAGQVH
ncbi:MAG TPA: branched-chain amino acid ABC transporter substrate-binding protein [Dehalococcoidia bacterium]|nr:branched-chain amino acid ABC transporter substrate-binding protein [Dehalococcoidia bacterium]